MRTKYYSILAISLMMIAFSSCKQNSTPLALFIPKNAAIVLEVDTKSVMDKIYASGMTLDSVFDMFNKNGKGIQWQDINNSGVDLTKPFFVFTNSINSIQNGNTQSFALVASLSARGQLETFLQKQFNKANIKTDNKYQYFDLSDGSVAGWTNDVIIVSSVKKSMQGRADEALSHQQLTTLFTQSESQSIASVSAFNNMLKKTGDIRFWSNASGNLSAIPMAGLTKISTLLQDTYTEGTIDFQNGKAIASFETHYNKTLADILEKYPAKQIDKSMVANYPNPVNGFGIVAFNPKVLIDILRYLGFDTAADGYTSDLGFTTADVVNAFSGDIAIIFSDFKMDNNSAPMPGMPMNKPGGEFLVNIKIGDTAAFNRVMNGLVGKGLLSQNGNQYQLGFFGATGFAIEKNAQSIFIASNDALIKAYEAGNNKNALPADIETEISNKSMAMYINIASMLQNINMTDADATRLRQTAQATFKNFIATADKSNGKTVTTNYELNMVQNENSLASLIKFMAVAHEESMKHINGFNIHPPFEDSIPDMNDEPENDTQ